MKLNIQLFAYTKTEWKDLPDETTPINADRLNNMENGIDSNTDNIKSNTDNIKNLQSQIDKLKQNLGASVDTTYDPTKTYNTGSFVLHDGLNYRATKDGITGDWDPTAWEFTPLRVDYQA